MKKILVFILVFCFMSSAAYSTHISDSHSHKKVSLFYNTNWSIKYLKQKSSFSFDRPLNHSATLYNFSHRFEWSNHLSNPPKLSYVLEPRYETNLSGLSALSLNGAVELKPDKHFKYQLGASIKQTQGLVLNGEVSYNW